MSETPGGTANTQGKDGAGGGLESEAGEGKGAWVVLEQGKGWEVLEKEAEAEVHDGAADEERYVNLACK